MKETVGIWMANQCLDGFEVRLMNSKKINTMNIVRTFGVFDKTGNIVATKTHKY